MKKNIIESKIKKTNSPFIIAELSGNHNNDLNIALKSVEAIAKSGADAIKVQTYTPSCLTLPCKNEYFRIKDGLWKDKYLWDLYEGAKMPWEWHTEIFKLAKSLKLCAFSSPFSVKGVEFLEKIDCPMYKIASFEVMHVPLLKAIAKTKKPVIISLGVANNKEIRFALEILKKNASITLLYCISQYPAKIEDARLSNIKEINKKWAKYNVNIGISDHTLGISVPIVAALCGASVIEKHFILDKALGGVDSAFSLDFNEFSLMVKNVREACILRNDLNIKSSIFKTKNSKNSNFKDSKKNKEIKGREFGRSLFISKDVKKGDILSMDNIAVVRPSNGLSPLLLDSIIGLKFKQDCSAGTPLKHSHYA